MIYTTDNGLSLSDLGLYDKRFLCEPGLRVPLIARGPGIRRGAAPDAFVANIDLAADPHEQHNLLFDEAEASSRGVANTLAALKAELARLQREYQDDGRYADPATWPKAGVESKVESRPALGGKTVAEAIRLTAGD